MASPTPPRSIDRDQVNQLIEKLELDLAQVRSGTGDLPSVQAEIEQLRATLAAPTIAQAELDGALQSLHKRLGHFGDELFGDALISSHYVAWMGRILGLQ